MAASSGNRKKLTRIGVAYVIGGSFASSVHGEPRSTNDVDMVADLHRGDIEAVVEAVGSDCYVSRDAMTEAIRDGTNFMSREPLVCTARTSDCCRRLLMAHFTWSSLRSMTGSRFDV